MGALQPNPPAQRLDRVDLVLRDLFCTRWKYKSASTQHAIALWPCADFNGIVYAAPKSSDGANAIQLKAEAVRWLHLTSEMSCSTSTKRS